MRQYAPKAHIGKMTAQNPCDGCGRILPKGSVVLMRSAWSDGFRRRVRLCTDCQGVVYGCELMAGRRLDADAECMVRDVCECCDSFPVCDRVQYLRKQEPGELWLGDVDGVGVHADDYR